MAYSLTDLATAERHIADGEERVANLELSIEEARREGRDTKLPEKALATMTETLRLMVLHRSEIEASLVRRGELKTRM